MKKLWILPITLILTAVLSACRFFGSVTPVVVQPNRTDPTTAASADSGTQSTEPALDNSWLFPDSDRRYLNSQDLKDQTADTLLLARNEIYARRGYVFSDPELAAFFAEKAWYVPNASEADFSTDVFNKYEKSNVDLIRIYEQRINGTGFSEDNPYAKYYQNDLPYLIATSDTTELVEADYMGMTAEEASLARNEIMARHGYTFTDAQLLEYFLQHSWYLPDTPPGNSDSITLSDVEKTNTDILRDYQKKAEAEQTDSAYTHQVSCDMFSVTTPAYWAEAAALRVTPDSISFLEKASYDAGFGGHVFTVQLFETEGDYKQYPSYRLIGYLTDSAGNTYYVVVLYPTDVQFDLDNALTYNKMERETENILSTFTAAPGHTFRPV